MVLDEWLPDALSIGVPYELFFCLTPRALRAFSTAHAAQVKERDRLMHIEGMYTLAALRVALAPFFKNSKAEYPKTPYLEQIPMTEQEEEELQRKLCEQHALDLATRRANWQLAHQRHQNE